MTRTFKRGYIEYDSLSKQYVATVSKVYQNNDFGEYKDIDEDWIKSYSFESKEQAEEYLKNEVKVKEIMED